MRRSRDSNSNKLKRWCSKARKSRSTWLRLKFKIQSCKSSCNWNEKRSKGNNFLQSRTSDSSSRNIKSIRMRIKRCWKESKKKKLWKTKRLWLRLYSSKSWCVTRTLTYSNTASLISSSTSISSNRTQESCPPSYSIKYQATLPCYLLPSATWSNL